jgi:hypothetical protein
METFGEEKLTHAITAVEQVLIGAIHGLKWQITQD